MGKIVTLWGPNNGAGVSLLSIALAKQLKEKKISVCLLDLDLNNSEDIPTYLNILDYEHNIDNLFPYIEGKSFGIDVFNLNVIKEKSIGFDFMQGTKQIDKGPNYSLEQIKPILEVAKDIYDLVIINANSALDNVGTYVALDNSDAILVVLNQNVLHFKKYILKLKVIGKYKDKMQVIVNKYTKDVLLPKQDIEKGLKEEIFVIKEIDESNLFNAINTKAFNSFILSSKNKTFVKDLSLITDKLLIKFGFKEDSSKKKFLNK